MADEDTHDAHEGEAEEDGLAKGARFNVYEIVRPLGRGAFGAVYEALRHPLKKRTALKVLHPQHAKRTEVVARFVREAEVVAQLDHPHIVDVFDVGVHDGLPFLAMEFLEGEALTARIAKDGWMPHVEAVDLMLAVASAVASVHEKGIVHRDLKPDNIYLEKLPSGEVSPKLLDFGIAKVAEADRALTRTNAMLGTPLYMSPEQAHESKHIDGAADQWSLGVILYECVTGEHPFKGHSLLSLLNAITADEPIAPRDHRATVPEGLSHAILKALAKLPTKRWASVRSFGAALLPYASPGAQAKWTPFFASATEPTSDTIPAPSPSKTPPRPSTVAPLLTGTLEPATRPSHDSIRRSRTPLIAAVAGALAVIVGIGWAASRSGPAPTRPAAPAALIAAPTPVAPPPAPPLVLAPPTPVPEPPAPTPPAVAAPVVPDLSTISRHSLRGRVRPAPPPRRPSVPPRAPTRPARPPVARVDCPNGICPVD